MYNRGELKSSEEPITRPQVRVHMQMLALLGLAMFSFASMLYLKMPTSFCPMQGMRGQQQFDGRQQRPNNNVPCDWPPPLYPPFSNTTTEHPGLTTSMRKAKSFFDANPDTTFSYIDCGGALGVYRQGGLIPGDSDLDTRYAICETCGQPIRDRDLWGDLHGFISFNNFETWGDIGTRRQIKSKADQGLVNDIQRDLCLHEYAPGEKYWFHKNTMQKRAFAYRYGDFWFVKMPWKGVHDMETWRSKVMVNKDGRTHEGFQSNWDRSLAQIKNMDTNKDMTVSVKELDDYVIADGIIIERYRSQISARERCRAAAMLTFLLKYNYVNSFTINKQNNFGFTNGDHPLFKFPQCENLEEATIDDFSSVSYRQEDENLELVVP